MFVFKRGSVLLKNRLLIFILFISTVNHSITIDQPSQVTDIIPDTTETGQQNKSTLTESVIYEDKNEQLPSLDESDNTNRKQSDKKRQDKEQEIDRKEDVSTLENDNDEVKKIESDNSEHVGIISETTPFEESKEDTVPLALENDVMTDSDKETIEMNSISNNNNNDEMKQDTVNEQDREATKVAGDNSGHDLQESEEDKVSISNTSDHDTDRQEEAILTDNVNEGTTEDSIDKESEQGDEEQGDDIVTFEEFKNKMNQEVVNSKPPQGGPPVPLRQAYHNYALSECGAKVLESNKEAKNAGSILLENKDLYMLNPCSANVWFVIELCELVSVSILEISCFELFSSIPETIAVYTSDSYPNPAWEKLGIFTLTDERGSQKFPLEETVYTKFIKFEMLTHFGSEHYCPISTVKVLGSTMIEEYEFTESQRDGSNGNQQRNEDNPERIIQSDDGSSDSNIKGNPIKAATDAILSVIGKAVNGLISPDEDDDFLEDKLDGENDLRSSTADDDSNKFTDSQEFQEHSHLQQIKEEVNIAVKDSDGIIIEPTSPIIQSDSLVSATASSSSDGIIAPTNEPLGPNNTLSSVNTIESQQESNTLLMTEDVATTQLPQTESKTMHITSTKEVITSSDLPLSKVVEPLSNITGSSNVLEVNETIEEEGKIVSQTQSTLKPLKPSDSETTGPQYSQDVSNSPNGNCLSNDNGILDTTINNTPTMEEDRVATNKTNYTSSNDTMIDKDKIDTMLADDGDCVDSTVNNCTSNNNAVAVDDGNIADTVNGSANASFNNDSTIVTEEPSDNGNNASSHTPGAREKSVFVRLSNRINVLEVNMTLFDSYLDQISQSLKKNKNRTEDMQRTLERRMGVLNETVQFIRDQIHQNVSLLHNILSILAELNQSILYQNQEWSVLEDSILIFLMVIISLQAITILACCYLQLNKSSKMKGMQNSLQLIETQITDLSLHLRGQEKSQTVKLKNRNSINGVITRATDDNSKKGNSTTVTVFGGETLHTSLSSPNLRSISLPSLSQDGNSIQKWKKVEHKKHKKSSCKKAEQ